MATVLDLTTDALGDLGVLAEGEVPSASQGAQALRALNRLIDQWAAERLAIYTVTRTVFVITAGTQTYNVGAAQVVNVARPVFVDHVNFQDTSTSPTTEYPMDPLSDEEYAAIVQKAMTSPLPQSYYYEPTYPYGVITLWPKPTGTTLQGVLYAPQAVAQFALPSDTVSLPPGYAQMIVKNLALELTPSYGKQPDMLLVAQAAAATSTVKRSNRRVREMSFEAAACMGDSVNGRYNILTD